GGLSRQEPMKALWNRVLGIDVSPGVELGEERLEFAALPDGVSMIGVLAAAVVLTLVVWWLYRREGRDLSVRMRVILVGLRLLALLAVAVMLLEPLLVFSQKETVESNLLLVVDDSESMLFSDPYSDETQAVAIAAELKL